MGWDEWWSEWSDRWLSQRYKLSYLGFVGFFLVYSMRINMSVALVDMVNTTISASSDASSECPLRDNVSTHNNGGEFNWNTVEEANVLSSFYYGYMCTQLIGGYAATRLGGRLVYGLGVLIPGLLTFLTPFAAYLGVGYLIACRTVMGVLEGVTFPAWSVMMGLWVPAAEHSTLWTIATSGAIFGNVFTQPIVGYLCSLPLWRGWPLGFYITGLATLVWFCFWYFMAADSPEKSKSISTKELQYIKHNTRVNKIIPPVPWREILTSRAFIAILPAHVACVGIGFGIMSCLPLYLSNVQNFDITANGALSALPWIMSFTTTVAVGFISDWLIDRKYLNTTQVRKLNQALSCFLPALFLVLAGFAGCNTGLAVSYIVLAVTLYGFSNCAVLINHLDITNMFTGIVYGIDNTAGAASGFVFPLVVGALTADDPHSAVSWQHVFYFFAAVSVFGGVWFIALGTGQLQPWGLDTLETGEEREPLLVNTTDTAPTKSGMHQ